MGRPKGSKNIKKAEVRDGEYCPDRPGKKCIMFDKYCRECELNESCSVWAAKGKLITENVT